MRILEIPEGKTMLTANLPTPLHRTPPRQIPLHQGVILRFGLFELSPVSLELRKNGRGVHLQPQPAKVLCYLTQRPGELVFRDELRRHIWGDSFVDAEAGLNACIRDVRAALGDRASAPAYVETVPRRGYRFIAPVEKIEPVPAELSGVSEAPPPGKKQVRIRLWRPLAAALIAAALGTLGLGTMAKRQDLAPAARAARVDPEAREAMLEARYLLDHGHAAAAGRAAERAERATLLEPTWAEAWLVLGEALLVRPMPPREAMPAARAAFAQALAYDSTLAGAHLGLAHVHLSFDWDPVAAAKELAKAEELEEGSSDLHQTWAFFHLTSGNTDKALEHLHQALRLDPVKSRIHGDIGWIYALSGDSDAAIEQCGKALELEPEAVWLHGCLVEAYRARGDLDLAVQAARHEMSGREASAAELARLDAGGAQALAALADWRLKRLLRKREERYIPSCAIGIRYAEAGQPDEALRFLEMAYEERSGFMPFLEISKALRPLREEPRFQALAQRMRSEMRSGRAEVHGG